MRTSNTRGPQGSLPSPGRAGRRKWSRSLAGTCGLGLFLIAQVAAAESVVRSASWDSGRGRLTVFGTGDRGETVAVVNAYDTNQELGTTTVGRSGSWRVRATNPNPVPCAVAAWGASGAPVPVVPAPSDCSPDAPAVSQPPTANAGVDQTVTLAASQTSIKVTLDGSGSSDPDPGGAIDAYNWTGTPDPDNTVSPTVTLAAGSYEFFLTVTDNDNVSSAADTVKITVNQPPTANAGMDQTVTLAVGETNIDVTLDGSGSIDPDLGGSIITYDWTGTPDPDNSVSPTVNLSAGTYSFTLRVTDNYDAVSTADTVTITVELPVIGGDPHASITEYAGPETCLECHEEEARQMHGSVHYQQSGPTEYVTNILGPAGERWNGPPGDGFTGINTYCGTHLSSPRFTCAGCHVGNGRFPKTPDWLADLARTQAEEKNELANIDCLMCHQERYKRFPDPAGGFDTLTIVAPDENGKPNGDGDMIELNGLLGIPTVDSETGDFQFIPADPNNSELQGIPGALMEISAVEAARTVHPTTRKSCLNCHAGAGGRDGAKRGDFSSAWADPSLEMDMHMSSGGQGLVCSDCHDAGNHRLRGRGLDLRPNDVPERFTCENGGCHTERPHGDYSSRYGSRRDTHAGRVACQTCHIPTYAKGFETEVARNWADPEYSPKACNGRGGYLPAEVKLSNLTPTYAWFDGTSEVTYIGQSLAFVAQETLGASEAAMLDMPANPPAPVYVLGRPNGDVSGGGAKLHPMKEHWSKMARHEATDTLVPQSTYEFFRTGSFDAAVQSGMRQTATMKEGDAYEVVAVKTYQTINHGVETADNALGCGDCHGSSARMNLKDDLGYGLKGPEAEVCTQCHGPETKDSYDGGYFSYIHDKHVRDKGKDCSTCHSFSRPERGLSTSTRNP